MTESAPYTVTGTLGEIELRRYPELVLASVEDPGDDSGFQHLFRYITGNNRSKNRIAMTAPVITGEKIQMTSPVITTEQIPMTSPVFSVSGSMSFVMPEGRTEADLPEPSDDSVRLVTIPSREVAVLRFRGRASRDEVNYAASALVIAVEKAGIRTKGGVFLMRYNPPWTPGFLRRNEVAIEIVR
ncbi:MAG TPA: heme-binding protein [Methanoregulaceae archaeon]|nr:heme-binding protein [Methanoregulaceae archaeon]